MTVLVGLAAVNILDARSLLTAFGVAGIFVVLFAETDLLVGFFLPGDSLLFTGVCSVAGPTWLGGLSLGMPPISMVLFALIVAVVAYFATSRSDQPTNEPIDRPTVTMEAA